MAGMLGIAQASETLWVYGVNEYGGWFDADKQSSSEDFGKCWAAVSANLINWWQNQYVVPSNYYTIPTGDAVWERYRKYTKPVMSEVYIGLDWWWYNKFRSEAFNFYGPLYSPYMTATDYYNNFEKYVYTVEAESVDLSSYLYNALSSGDVRPGIGINVGSSPTAPAHGITFWGAEFDEEKKLTALWVTDSDDNILNKADSDSAAVDLGLFKVNVEITEQGYYLSDYWYEDARYIDALTVLDATQTDGWNLERVYLTAPVPEPATATLSLLGLVALAARRRRQ